VSRGDRNQLVLAVLAVRILLAQAVLAYAVIGTLLFVEGMLHFGVRVALRNAAERASFAAVAVALVVTVAHLLRSRTGVGLSPDSVLGVERFAVPLPAAGFPPPGVGAVDLGDLRWRAVPQGTARWLTDLQVAVTGEEVVVESTPRHPFLLPGQKGKKAAGALLEKLR
jgi:hypothetical protein